MKTFKGYLNKGKIKTGDGSWCFWVPHIRKD